MPLHEVSIPAVTESLKRPVSGGEVCFRSQFGDGEGVESEAGSHVMGQTRKILPEARPAFHP